MQKFKVKSTKFKEEWEVSSEYIAKMKVDNIAEKNKEKVELYNEQGVLIYTANPK